MYALRKAIESGEVIRIFRGCYAKASANPYEIARDLCKLIPDFVLSQESAEQLFLGQALTFPIQGYVSHRRRSINNPWLQTKRKRLVQCTDHRGIRVVTGYQKVIFEGHTEGAAAMYSGRRGALRMREDQRAHPRQRKAADAIIKRYGADSGAETKVAAIIRKMGFEPEHNVMIAGYSFDLVVPEKRIVIEIDSWEHHKEQHQFVRDRVKGNEAAIRDWILLRISGLTLAHHPDYVETLLREAFGVSPVRAREHVWRWHHVSQYLS